MERRRGQALTAAEARLGAADGPAEPPALADGEPEAFDAEVPQ
jgi:hypothetical protein